VLCAKSFVAALVETFVEFRELFDKGPDKGCDKGQNMSFAIAFN
jgi:hypothetical protein